MQWLLYLWIKNYLKDFKMVLFITIIIETWKRMYVKENLKIVLLNTIKIYLEHII